MGYIVATPEDFRPGGGAKPGSGIAGVGLDMFDVLFKDLNDGNKWKLAVNSAPESCTGLAIAASFAALDAQVFIVQPGSGPTFIESANPLWIGGETYIVSNVDGQMMLAGDIAAGQYLSLVGFAETTTRFRLAEITTGFQK